MEPTQGRCTSSTDGCLSPVSQPPLFDVWEPIPPVRRNLAIEKSQASSLLTRGAANQPPISQGTTYATRNGEHMAQASPAALPAAAAAENKPCPAVEPRWKLYCGVPTYISFLFDWSIRYYYEPSKKGEPVLLDPVRRRCFSSWARTGRIVFPRDLAGCDPSSPCFFLR